MQLSPLELLIIAILVLVEFALLIGAWIVLFRTPAERLTLPKWAWALICLIQFVGPIAFFAVGRTARVVEDTAPQDAGSSTKRALDDLYGER